MGLKDFQVVSKLGEGAFSSVYKVKRISDGQEYAMKKVKMASLSEKEKQNALNEVRILASIKNPFIIGYKEAFFEDNSVTLCIVMEYAGGGDVYNKIVQHQKARTYFKEEDIWNYAIQMIVGLKTLHDMRILHRDLKCANIFLSKDGKEVKLGDLNVSKVAKTNLVYTQTGTPYYASPEVWRDQPYDSKSDIWSLGCVLYEMCALKPPFRANDMSGLNKRIQRGVFDRIPSQFSTELHNLISLCLQVSPSLRPSCDKLLSHPSILKHGQEFVKNLDEFFGPNELLGTIKLPRNIKALGEKLPKPNYDEVRSEGSDKGRLNRSDEEEKQGPVKRPQRAVSQQGKRIVDKALVKPPSRHYRIPSGQKEAPISQNPEPKMQVRQKIALEKPRQIYIPSPKLIEKDENAKIYNNDRIVVRRQIEPLDRKKGGILQENLGPIFNVRIAKQGQENIDQNIRVEKKPRQQVREKINISNDKGYSEQDYLVNKYLGLEQAQNNNYNRKVLDRVYSDRNDLAHRRADDIVRKYYADAVLAEKREPLSEMRLVGGTPVYDYVNRGGDILDRYNNAYNMKEPTNRPPSSRNAKYRKVDSSNIGQNNAGNNINLQRQQEIQQRGVVKPSWWG